MILSIFLFLLFFAIGLFIAGFFYVGELKYGSQILHIASCFLILMCGLIVLTQGIDFKIGSTITEYNSTTTVVSYQYESFKGLLEGSSGISLILIMLSFAMFIYTFFEFKYERNKSHNYSEEED